MQRYFIQLAFNGTKYHGWQVQPNAVTVQEVITKAVSVLTGEQVEITGAGRTDTGVHASFYVAHFDLNIKKDPDFLCNKLNAFLPDDIIIKKIFPIESDYHARFSATSRTYRYSLSEIRQPFKKEFTAYYPHKLNIELMREACAILKEYTDFTSFSKLHTDVKTNNCIIYYADWKIESDIIFFEISADRFLRNMVRSIVGTMIDIGRGKTTLQGLREIIEAKNRSRAGTSVPAKGLFLFDIRYPEEIDRLLLR
jgi:tRNA pseudouridine38-40 synthase